MGELSYLDLARQLKQQKSAEAPTSEGTALPNGHSYEVRTNEINEISPEAPTWREQIEAITPETPEF